MVLQEDRLGHRRYRSRSRPRPPRPPSRSSAARALADVRQQRELAGALDRARDLVLMPAAGARDAARADLAAVGDELLEGGDVLVVDELHLVAAVLAGLPASAAPSGLAIPPACRPAALLGHCSKTSLAADSLRMRAPRARGQTPDGAGPHRVAERAPSASVSSPRPFAKSSQRFCGGTGVTGRIPPSPPVDSTASQRVRKEPAEMAATNINRVVITGNLTRDPELRSLPSGMSVCSLRIASNTRRKDNARASGSTSRTTSASPCGARRARTAPASCPRAVRSRIDGRLEWREWQGQDGAKRESVEIVADAVQFLGGRDDAAMGGAAPATASRRTRTSRRTRRTSRRSRSARATPRRPRTTTSRSRAAQRSRAAGNAERPNG